MLANLPKIKAQQTIHAGNFDATDYDGVYRMYLTAFGDVALARLAKRKALECYVDSKVKAPIGPG